MPRWRVGILGLAVLLGALCPAAPARADTPPGQAVLSAQLTGYGAVFLTSTAQQGSNAINYISVTAQMGGNTAWFADVVSPSATASGVLPDCGSVTLSAQAVDVSGEIGAVSAPVILDAPCGPEISSFGPNDSTATGEVLDWSPVAGQDTSAYVVAASPGPASGVADPLPLQIAVTSGTVTSATYLFTAATAQENLFYRVYAVDQNGVTSTAASCCLDKAYSFGVQPVQSYNAPDDVSVAVSTQPFVPAGPTLPLNYTFYGSTTTAGFTPLTTVAVSAGDVTSAASLILPAQDPAANPDQYFYFSVSDGAVATPLSPLASALLFAPDLLTPTVSVASDNASGVVLTWGAVSNATGYSVYRTDGATPYAVVSQQAASSFALNDGQYSYTDSSSYLPTGGAPSVGPLSYAVQAYSSLSSTILVAPSAAVDQSALSAPVTVNNPIAAAPPELTALATGTRGTVALTWSQAFNPPGPLSTYVVYYSTLSANPAGNGVTSTVVPSTQTALTVTKFPSGAALPDGVLAWFWLASNNGSGPGAFSAGSPAIPYTEPLAPTLTAGVLPYGQGVSLSVSVTGTPDVALAEINVFASGNALTPVAALEPAALSTTLSAGLFPCGTPVTLTAQAVDIQGDTGPADKGVWLEPPCAPAASASSLSDGALALAWTQPSGGSGDTYVVYAATGPGLNPDSQSPALTTTEFTAPAAPGQSPWYSVAAVDRFGVSSPASASVGLLEPPSGLEALPGAGQVALFWTAPPSADSVGLDGYRVYYSSAAAFVSGTALFGVSPGASSLTVSSQASGVTVGGLVNLTPYAFAVASLAAPDDSVSGAASAMVSATTGLQGPKLGVVETSPPLGESVVFAPLTPTGAGGALVPATPPSGTLLAQWTLGSYTPLTSTVFTLYRAVDPSSTPQTFDTITPVATAAYSALYVSLPAAAPGPAWYFLNVTDAAGTNLDGGVTTDARSVASAFFAPDLAPVSLTLAAPVSNGRVQLSWAAVPYADSYTVYRATQDEPAVGASGVTYSALDTSDTPATFFELGSVPADLGVAQDFGYTDTAPVENARNAYEVVPSLTLAGGGQLFGLAGDAVTCTPRILPQDPGFWAWPGGNDGTVDDASSGGDVGGVSGYYVTAAAMTSPMGGVFLEWTPSGEGTYPLSYYAVYRGYSPLNLTQVGAVAADVTSTTASSSMPSYTDLGPPQPLAGLVYGVSAVDIRGVSSADIVTTTVQAPALWPAPESLPNPGLAGLCPDGYCPGTKAVTLTWAPGVAYVNVTPPSGPVLVTVSAGTFPFQSWQVSRIPAPGAAPVVLAGPGASDGADVSVSAGSLAWLSQTTLTDLSPVAGSPAYVIAAVDSQGEVGTPLSVSVSVPVSSFRSPPLAVTGLTATAAVVQTAAGPVLGAALSWTPNAPQDNVSAYEVFRQDFGSTPLTETPLTTYADPAAGGGSDPAGTTVVYTVQAVNNSNQPGPSSAPCDFTLAPPAPAFVSLTADIPAGVSLSPAVGLSWQDVLGIQSAGFDAASSGGSNTVVGSYTVYRSDQPGTPLPGCVGLSLSAECADTSPVAQASYQVASVVSVNGVSVASTARSPSLSVAFKDLVPLSPTSLTATATSSGVGLSWTAAAESGAYEYWIYRSTVPMNSAPPYADTLARVTGTAYTDLGLLATAGLTASTQTEPYYAVAPASPWVVGAALTASASLSPPTDLSAFAGGTGLAPDVSATVSLFWAPSVSSVVTGYNVWRAPGALGLTVSAFLASVTGTSYTDVLSGASAGLTNTTLSYTVMAEGLSQSSACSTPATVTAYDLPRTPVGLSGNGLDNGVDATWKPDYASQGVTGYALAWTVLNGGGGGLTQVAASASEWTLGGLVPGQSVTLSAQALNSAGGSPWTAAITLTASADGPPPAPDWVGIASGLPPGAAAPTGCAITLNLGTTAAGLNGFEVYRSPAPGALLPPSPGNWAPLRLSDCAGGPASPYYLTTLPGTLESLTDTSVAAGYPYSYAVTALGPLGLPGQESAPLASSPLTITAFNTWAPPAMNGLAGNGLVSLWWTPPAASGAGSYPLSGFLLYRQAQGPNGAVDAVDPGFPLLLSLTQTAYTDHQVVNVQPGVTGGYAYWMTCLDTHGNPSLSATVGTLYPEGLLAPPMNLTAVPGDGSVLLQWIVPQSDVSSGAVYNVYRRRVSGVGSTYGPPLPSLFHIQANPSGFPTAVSLQTETAQDPPGLASSPPDLVEECYAVTAVDSAGEGPKSPDVCVTPFKQLNPADTNWNVAAWPSPKVVVNDNSGSRISSITVGLSWNPIPWVGYSGNGGYNVAGYYVGRSQNQGASFTTLDFVTETSATTSTSSSPQFSYTDTGAQEGQSYLYRIQPLDTGGNLGLPYDYNTVQIPAGQNSLYVYRNSFDPMTGGSVNVQVGLQQSGNFWVKVYTLNGEYVATIVPPTYSFGSSGSPYLSTVYTWNGTNSRGQVVASGVYLLHLQGPGYSTDARVAVIK